MAVARGNLSSCAARHGSAGGKMAMGAVAGKQKSVALYFGGHAVLHDLTILYLRSAMLQLLQPASDRQGTGGECGRGPRRAPPYVAIAHRNRASASSSSFTRTLPLAWWVRLCFLRQFQPLQPRSSKQELPPRVGVCLVGEKVCVLTL